MSSVSTQQERPKCAFCPNFAFSTCDAWSKELGQVCALPICYQCRKRTFYVDCCPKHFRSERRRQSELAVTKQQNLFSQFELQGGEAMK